MVIRDLSELCGCGQTILERLCVFAGAGSQSPLLQISRELKKQVSRLSTLFLKQRKLKINIMKKRNAKPLRNQLNKKQNITPPKKQHANWQNDKPLRN